MPAPNYQHKSDNEKLHQLQECPTAPFTILEPSNQEIGLFWFQERRSEATKLWKGQSVSFFSQNFPSAVPSPNKK